MTSSIAIVLPDLRMGGGQRVLLQLARQFIDRGHLVDIVTVVGDGELVNELPSGARHCALLSAENHINVWQGLKALVGLARYLRRARPDAVLSSMTGTNLLTATASCMVRAKGRLLLREAASFANLRSRFFPVMMRALYRRADALVAVSHGVAGDLARLGIANQKIQVINNGIDVERLQKLASVSPAYELKYPYVVSIARLVQQKDHATLLRAYAQSRLAQSHRLVIVGDGELKRDLALLAKQLGIEDRVHWQGAMGNPYPILAKASLFVLSSRWEGYPNVLLEAAGLGIPIVSTDCPDGPRELLKNGRCGRLVPVGDHAAMARAMEDELQQPSGNLGDIVQAHQPQAVAGQYLNLLFAGSKKGDA